MSPSRHRTSRAPRRFFQNQVRRFGVAARVARAVAICFTPIAAIAVGAQLTAAPTAAPRPLTVDAAAVAPAFTEVAPAFTESKSLPVNQPVEDSTPAPEAIVSSGGVDSVGRPLVPAAGSHSAAARHSAAAIPSSALKAVVIVGPSGSLTDSNLAAADEFAARAESYGMDVRRVFHPHATWDQVLANVQGANLVAYFGHGNSYPSPYGPFQEKTKDGFGLDSFDGASVANVTYYGANFIREQIHLAPDSVVALSHLCYSAGNGEPGMPVPTWEVAQQRVDNTASGFLSAGAKAVFAYATGSITPLVDGLFTSAGTIDQLFMTAGDRPEPYYGFTGWDDRYFDSVRMPGARNHLDPGETVGFLRAVTGDLDMPVADWLRQ